MTPELSVVIPCFNGEKTIGRQLAALAGQETDAEWEIVVADNGSTDGSADLVARYATKALVRIRVVDASSNPGINHARNVGIRASVGRYILFCDADDIVDPGWVAAHLASFRSGATLVGGPVRPTDERTGQSISAQTEGFPNVLGYLPWPAGANCGFARDVYESHGPLDETLRGGGDETEFFWRAQIAGHQLTFVEGAAIAYVQRSSLASRYRQFRQYGRAHTQLFARFRDHGMPRASTVRGALWWLAAPFRLPLGLLVPSWRARTTGDVALRVGRLRESLRLKVLYL